MRLKKQSVIQFDNNRMLSLKIIAFLYNFFETDMITNFDFTQNAWMFFNIEKVKH